MPTLAFDESGASCVNPLDCAANSVVSLLPDWPADFSRSEEPEGSGIVLENGRLIATADHVLGPANSANIRTRDGRIMKAKVVLREPLTDIALLEIPNPLNPIRETADLSLGAEVCAAGNSFGLNISITCGVVSAVQVSGVGFNQIEDFIQTDAAVNPGMSGGALIDRNGKLAGMLSAIFTKGSDANLGVNFAVSPALLLAVVDDFKQHGEARLNRPGIIAKPSSTNTPDTLLGVEVIRVLESTPEASAGIEVGDVILRAGKRRMVHPAAYAATLALLKQDETLELLIWRTDAELTINIKPKQ